MSIPLIDKQEDDELAAVTQEAKSIKNKYTLILGLLFFVEILPLPFTAFISLYTVRKRPDWFPYAVKSLYKDIPPTEKDTKSRAVDPKVTQRKCTYTIATMMLIDLGPVPLTIPVGLFIVRRRPKWFRKVAENLYADKVVVSGHTAAKRVRLYDD